MRRSSSRSFNICVSGHNGNEKLKHSHEDTLLSNEKIFSKLPRDKLIGEKNKSPAEYKDTCVSLNENVREDSLLNPHNEEKISSMYECGKERRTREIILANELKSSNEKEYSPQKRHSKENLMNYKDDPRSFLIDKKKQDKIRSILQKKKKLVEQDNMQDSSPPVSHCLEEGTLQDYTNFNKKKDYHTLIYKQQNGKDSHINSLEEPLQSLDMNEKKEESVKSNEKEQMIIKTLSTEDISYKGKPGTRRAMSVDVPLTRHGSKSNNFRLAKESGKDICVCGASAFWERERIALTTERVRLKQKADSLRSETIYLRETRNRLHSRLLDLENFETDMKSRWELLIAKEKANETESERLMRLQTEIKLSREEATRLLEQVTLKERNVQVDKRKHEKEISSLREQETFITSECRRLRDLACRLEKKKQEFTAVEESLQEAKKQLKTIRDELQTKKIALDKQNQDLLDVAYNLCEERKALEQREKALQVELSQVNSRTQDINEKEKNLREEQKRVSVEREKLSKEQEEMLVKIQKQKEALNTENETLNTEKEALNAERQALNAEREEFVKQSTKDKEIWLEEIAEEKRKLDEITHALQNERNFYERQYKELQTFQEELLKKQEEINEHVKQVYEKEENLKKAEEIHKKETQDFHEMRVNLEKTQIALNASQKTLKEEQLKTTTQLEILGKEREQIANEMKAMQQNKSVLERKMKELNEKETQLTQRESVLLSKEARSQWHQDIMKDMNDMKDRYELQLQDLELEKRSFAELKADVLAEQERASIALRLREQSLAALEASIRTKHAEMLRREKLTSLRGATDTFLTSSPLRHTCKTRMISQRHTILRPESTHHRSQEAYETTSCEPSTQQNPQCQNDPLISGTSENISQSLDQENKVTQESTPTLQKNSLHEPSKFLQRSRLSSCSAATLLESPAFVIHENFTHEKTSNTTTRNNTRTLSYEKPIQLSSYPTFETLHEETSTPSLLRRLPQETTILRNEDNTNQRNSTILSTAQISHPPIHENVHINKLDVSTNSVPESPLLTI